jgi:hypothetical protein
MIACDWNVKHSGAGYANIVGSIEVVAEYR